MIYPAEYDITILQGATYARRFVWKSGADKEPVNLTGATVRMQARLAKPLDEVLLEASEADGRFIVEDPLQGLVYLNIPAEVTDELTFRKGVYDIEIEMPDGFVHRLLEGRIFVDPQVTR